MKKAIRFQGGIGYGDHIAVALSGGPSSSALAQVLSRLLSGRRDTVLSAITVNEGRSDCIRTAREIAADLAIGLRVDSTSDRSPPDREFTEFGSRLYDLARKSGATKLALGSTVEDCAFGVFTALFSGEMQKYTVPGTNQPTGCPGLTVLQPISSIPEEEARLYAKLTSGIVCDSGPAGPGLDRTGGLRVMFTEFCRKHPSTPFALLRLGEELGIQMALALTRPGYQAGPSPDEEKYSGVYAD